MNQATLGILCSLVFGLLIGSWQGGSSNPNDSLGVRPPYEQVNSAVSPSSVSTLEPTSTVGSWTVDRAINGTSLNIGGIVYAHGIGSSVPSRITYKIPEGYSRLAAWAGFDVTSADGKGRLRVLVDGEVAFDTGKIEFQNFQRGPGVNSDRAIKVSIPLDEASEVTLVAEGSNEKLLANWADVRLFPPEWRICSYCSRR